MGGKVLRVICFKLNRVFKKSVFISVYIFKPVFTPGEILVKGQMTCYSLMYALYIRCGILLEITC